MSPTSLAMLMVLVTAAEAVTHLFLIRREQTLQLHYASG